MAGPWAAVIGSPIDHSLSPALHAAAYELAGLDWEYRRYEVNKESLPAFMASLPPGCKGLSVTMPCKQAIVAYADTTDALAKAVGASNTLVMAGGLRACFNTDVHGIVEALRRTYKQRTEDVAGANRERGAHGVILGTGATASSAMAALVTLGVTDVSVVGRNFQGPGNVTLAANRLGVTFTPLYWKHQESVVQAMDTADVIVSTVPPSVSADLGAAVAPREQCHVLDVTYSAGPTELDGVFSAAGALIASPLAMLTAQGIAQVKLMSGREVPFDPVYEAVQRAAE